jgi:hypothetical protein
MDLVKNSQEHLDATLGIRRLDYSVGYVLKVLELIQ